MARAPIRFGWTHPAISSMVKLIDRVVFPAKDESMNNRMTEFMDQQPDDRGPDPSLFSPAFAFCFLPGAHPLAMMMQMAAHKQAVHDVSERAKREEWQQIMARCGIDYQI